MYTQRTCECVQCDLCGSILAAEYGQSVAAKADHFGWTWHSDASKNFSVWHACQKCRKDSAVEVENKLAEINAANARWLQEQLRQRQAKKAAKKKAKAQARGEGGR